MSMKFFAVLAVAAIVPTFAFAEDAKPTKADVDKVVKSIQADKAKTQQYCDMMKAYDDAAAADDKKDSKAAQELSAKADDLGKKLGADYEKLMTSLQKVDPSSKEGQELSSALDPLDASCKK